MSCEVKGRMKIEREGGEGSERWGEREGEGKREKHTYKLCKSVPCCRALNHPR